MNTLVRALHQCLSLGRQILVTGMKWHLTTFLDELPPVQGYKNAKQYTIFNELNEIPNTIIK